MYTAVKRFVSKKEFRKEGGDIWKVWRYTVGGSSGGRKDDKVCCSKRDHRLARAAESNSCASIRLRGKSAMIRRSIIDPYRRIVVGMWRSLGRELLRPRNSISTRQTRLLDPAHIGEREREGERELERRAFKRRVTIITRPQFIIQTLCTGSRIWPSTLMPAQPTANGQICGAQHRSSRPGSSPDLC